MPGIYHQARCCCASPIPCEFTSTFTPFTMKLRLENLAWRTGTLLCDFVDPPGNTTVEFLGTPPPFLEWCLPQNPLLPCYWQQAIPFTEFRIKLTREGEPEHCYLTDSISINVSKTAPGAVAGTAEVLVYLLDSTAGPGTGRCYEPFATCTGIILASGILSNNVNIAECKGIYAMFEPVADFCTRTGDCYYAVSAKPTGWTKPCCNDPI
jgi:hypothetical protein